ncbi:MAG: hypothetical protein Kow0027_10360 [Saprospiraceae bacterium]
MKIVKNFMVVGVICVHEGVPKVEIQAVVTTSFLMVEVMVCRGIEPPEKGMPDTAPGEYLKPQMTHYIEQ